MAFNCTPSEYIERTLLKWIDGDVFVRGYVRSLQDSFIGHECNSVLVVFKSPVNTDALFAYPLAVSPAIKALTGRDCDNPLFRAALMMKLETKDYELIDVKKLRAPTGPYVEPKWEEVDSMVDGEIVTEVHHMTIRTDVGLVRIPRVCLQKDSKLPV